MSQASWAKDLLNYIDSVVYGEAEILPIVVKREHKKTVVIETKAIETLEKSGKNFEFPVTWGTDLQKEHENY